MALRTLRNLISYERNSERAFYLLLLLVVATAFGNLLRLLVVVVVKVAALVDARCMWNVILAGEIH
jgi:hypothetical protein